MGIFILTPDLGKRIPCAQIAKLVSNLDMAATGCAEDFFHLLTSLPAWPTFARADRAQSNGHGT